METNKLINSEGITNSLQISHMGNLEVGEHSFADPNGEVIPFLVKNITNENVTINITPYSQETSLTTVLYPGWNVELCRKVNVITANTLQYGY